MDVAGYFEAAVQADPGGSVQVNLAPIGNGDVFLAQLAVPAFNFPPVINAIADRTVNEGSTLTFTVASTDLNPGDSVTYGLDPGAPGGASIDATTGVVTWMPTEAQGPGIYAITIRATDNGSPPASSTQTVTITVNEVNQAPILAALPNLTVFEGVPLTFTAMATDADLPANALTFSLLPGAPLGASINATTGVFTWTPTEAQGPGMYNLGVEVVDDGSPSLSDTKTFTISVREVNQAPVLQPIANQAVDVGSLLTFVAPASDADIPANTLSYSLDDGAPAGARIDAATGIFTWRPASTQDPGTYQTTVRVTDDGSPSLSASQTVTITVNEVTQGLAIDVAAGTISEAAGAAATSGTVTRIQSDTSTALVVALTSSNTSAATVPASVTIPAGQTSITFPIDAVDDDLLDGIRTVTITASAAGYANHSSTLAITDHETLTVSVTPLAVSENAGPGAATATVTRSNTDNGSPLAVTLTSSNTSAARVPATVTIPAGQASATFAVDPVDDNLLDGTRTVTLTASAAGYVHNSGVLAITDYETLSLTFAANSVAENAGNAATTATVTRSNTDNSSALVVQLADSNTGVLRAPATVTIPTGQASATFPVDVFDDTLLDGTRMVSLTASAAGYQSGTAILAITDFETLSVVIAAHSIAENAGTAATTGTVTRGNTDINNPLVVTLASSDAAHATVPPMVTIPAGQASATFAVGAIQDNSSDATHTVMIMASAAGYITGSDALAVTNYDGAVVRVTFHEFPVPNTGSKPDIITAGPDGNLWFTEKGGIGQVSTAGNFMQFPGPNATDMTTGPDGNLWFTDPAHKIGRITPAGVMIESAVLPPSTTGRSQGFGADPWGIVTGPDGNLWFTEWYGNRIGRMTPSFGLTEFPLPTNDVNPFQITVGPDGNLWFTENGGDKVGRITPTGVITEFAVPTPDSQPFGIVAGPDGNLWFTENLGNKVARITPGGIITEFGLMPGSSPVGITVGPDGSLWFAESDANKIGRITPAGAVTEWTIPTAASQPQTITLGPDGNLWFTEYNGNKIAEIVVGPPNRPPVAAADTAVTSEGMPVNINVLANDSDPDNDLLTITITVPPAHGTASVNNNGTPDNPADDFITYTPGADFYGTDRFSYKVNDGIVDSSVAMATVGVVGQNLAGVVTFHEFPVPNTGSKPDIITAGPDGNLWFTEKGGIGQVSTAGNFMQFPGPNATDMTTGPDGNLWFTDPAHKIGRITPAGTITESAVLPPSTTGRSQGFGADPWGIVTGPDGNLWFTEWYGNRIGRMTPSFGLTEFPLPTNDVNPFEITAGPDGNLWFTENGGNKIGRITPTGVITEFAVANAGQPALRDRGGPRRQPLVHREPGNKIGRITPGGIITEFGPMPGPARWGSRRVPTATSGSPRTMPTRSAGSRPRARSPNSRSRPRPASPKHHGGSRRQPLVYRI